MKRTIVRLKNLYLVMNENNITVLNAFRVYTESGERYIEFIQDGDFQNENSVDYVNYPIEYIVENYDDILQHNGKYKVNLFSEFACQSKIDTYDEDIMNYFDLWEYRENHSDLVKKNQDEEEKRALYL
ncbi:MAG: hypothetical protein KH020_05420 [Clostridiales bacterium]|nr:hypothetical protein [Clostridiales bacterium]